MTSFEPEFIVPQAPERPAPAAPRAPQDDPAPEPPAPEPPATVTDASESADDADVTPAAPVADTPSLPPLVLREQLPPVVDTDDLYAATCRAIASGSGPVAIDAERASGYRYSQRAYLVQLRRVGSGTHLVDPVPFADLTALDDAIGDEEWILHAATQDLPCLTEAGMRPRALFDTELAGRLLNLPRVGLATLVELYLGHSLAKEHSAADWSTRPLPEPWLVYAALDVEVLVELRDLLEAELERAGKLAWALQEFEALLSFTGPPPKTDRWRRTSGMHRIRGRRNLALVRELWETRDQIAERRDTTPGRVLTDAAIVEMATVAPTDADQLKGLRTMRGRGARRHLNEWQRAIDTALALPEDELPRSSVRGDGPPPPRAWAEKHPEAADRLGRCREVVVTLAEQHDLPAENLIAPGTVRELAWEPPADLSAESVGALLAEKGARPWQVELVSTPLSAALRG
ncbi:ribonuclease D [Aeromicrobium alkaliterrae]|uniref:Ribonuclease D n=1 Tax=Aeromicrobium alkaliterrae TaxID=302168 RepID=A0ABN2JIS9_9ACTN